MLSHPLVDRNYYFFAESVSLDTYRLSSLNQNQFCPPEAFFSKLQLQESSFPIFRLIETAGFDPHVIFESVDNEIWRKN